MKLLQKSILPNFGKRTASAIFIVIFTLLPIYYGSWLFSCAISLLCIGMLMEWNKMLADHNKNRLFWRIFGTTYITTPCICLYFIRNAEGGVIITFWLFLTVWATDVCAYILGTTIKSPKLLPKISPKKSYSGLIGAILGAVLIGYLFDIYIEYKLNYRYTYYSIIVALVAQAGDFLESYFKRFFGVKDSGNLIPGHGGLLDRFDGIITAALFTILII